jgi:hypothetical protein
VLRAALLRRPRRVLREQRLLRERRLQQQRLLPAAHLLRPRRPELLRPGRQRLLRERLQQRLQQRLLRAAQLLRPERVLRTAHLLRSARVLREGLLRDRLHQRLHLARLCQEEGLPERPLQPVRQEEARLPGPQQRLLRDPELLCSELLRPGRLQLSLPAGPARTA